MAPADPSSANDPTASHPLAAMVADGDLRAALEAMIDDVAIGIPVRDDDGAIVDFVMVYASDSSQDGAGRPTSSMVGRRVTEVYPGWRESGLMDRFAEVVETGVPYIDDRREYTDVRPDGTTYAGYWSVSVARLGDGYVAASRDVTSLVRQEEARRAASVDADRNRWAAELLQRVALPETIPRPPGFEIGAWYVPAASVQTVGGDWYDALELGDGRIGVAIGDVAGHGADAAAYMVQARNIVRGHAVVLREPSAVLAAANAALGELGSDALYATCCYGVLDPAARTFRWARAGHLDPLLLGVEARHLSSKGGPPLGVDPQASHPETEVVVAEGERVVLYTDGLVERRDRSLQAGLDELLAIGDQIGDLDADGTVAALAATVRDRDDDLAVLCLRAIG